jgi:hypothetical protein
MSDTAYDSSNGDQEADTTEAKRRFRTLGELDDAVARGDITPMEAIIILESKQPFADKMS